MAEIKLAPDVEEIALEEIAEWHEHLRANGTRILYLHSDQDRARRGRALKADMISLGGTQYTIGVLAAGGSPSTHDYDFALVVYGAAWEGLGVKQRRAAVDEQLCRLVEKTVRHRDGDEIVIKLQDPDVSVFLSNFEHFGAWTKSLRSLVSKGRQLPLDLAGEAEDRTDADQRERVGAANG